jgi:hypothetical protein
VPESAMEQESQGLPWTVVPGMMNNIAGGHDVTLVGHHPDWWVCVTWGHRQPMTWEFLQATCDEAWCYLDDERYSAATGLTYNGYASVDLERYIAEVGKMGGVHELNRRLAA